MPEEHWGSDPDSWKGDSREDRAASSSEFHVPQDNSWRSAEEPLTDLEIPPANLFESAADQKVTRHEIKGWHGFDVGATVNFSGRKACVVAKSETEVEPGFVPIEYLDMPDDAITEINDQVPAEELTIWEEPKQ